jgi:hypothetical protein
MILDHLCELNKITKILVSESGVKLRDRFEDATLPALKMEERAMNKEYKQTLESEKSREWLCPYNVQKDFRPANSILDCWTLDL